MTERLKIIVELKGNDLEALAALAQSITDAVVYLDHRHKCDVIEGTAEPVEINVQHLAAVST